MFELLSDDLVQQIFFFVSSGKELSALSKTHQRANELIFHHNHDGLFQTLWRYRYGNRGEGGRQNFQSLYYFRQLLALSISNTNSRRSLCRFAKAGLLSDDQEKAARLYETNQDEAECMGYFGMKQLWSSGPFAVWGDYAGVRLLSGGRSQILNEKERTFVEIGKDVSRVLSLVVEQQYLFLAFASGLVTCVRITKTAQSSSEGSSSNNDYIYETISSTSINKDEVTSLSIVSTNKSPSGLFSGCVDGKVYQYPRAVTEGSLEGGRLVCELGGGGNAVLTISTLCHESGRTFLLIGDASGTITLRWGAFNDNKEDEWSETYSKVKLKKSVPTQSLLWSTESDLYVLCGDNLGGISLWQVNPFLGLEFVGKKQTRSMVESFEVTGNLLLVCGGFQISCFTLPAGDERDLQWQGTLQCYTTPLSTILSSCLCHEQQSCVLLCRDGTVQEISYGPESLSRITVEKNSNESRKGEGSAKKGGRPSSRKRKKSLKSFESVSSVPFYDMVPVAASMGTTVTVTNVPTINGGESIHKRPRIENFLVPQEDLSLENIETLLTKGPKKDANAIKMRIIQEAFQRHEKGTNQLFVGSTLYRVDIERAFEQFSGMSLCRECQLSGETISNYKCRVHGRHSSGLSQDSFRDQLVAKYCMNASSSPPVYQKNGWICSRCCMTCSGKRCGLCLSWKGNRRENFGRKNGDDWTKEKQQTRPFLNPTKAPKRRAKSTFEETSCKEIIVSIIAAGMRYPELTAIPRGEKAPDRRAKSTFEETRCKEIAVSIIAAGIRYPELRAILRGGKHGVSSGNVCSPSSSINTLIETKKDSYRTTTKKTSKLVWTGPPDEKVEGGWPDGWIKKVFEREYGASRGRLDRFWYPPGEGREFRSLVDVKRFLNGRS